MATECRIGDCFVPAHVHSPMDVPCPYCGATFAVVPDHLDHGDAFEAIRPCVHAGLVGWRTDRPVELVWWQGGRTG